MKKLNPDLCERSLPEIAEAEGETLEAVKQIQKKAARKFKRNFERIKDYKVYLEDL